MEREARTWRTVALAGVVAALAGAYWHWRLVLAVALPQPVNPWNGDLYDIYVPIYMYAYRSARWLPTWNPYQLAGTPFVASYNGGFFYPPNFLSAVLPVPVAIGYASACHLALAGVLAFACARTVGLGAAGATLAATGFMLNDYFLLERMHPSYFAALAWIPGVLLAAGRVAVAPTVGRGAVLGLALAAQLLAGHAQIVCYEAYVLLLLVVAYRLLHSPPGRRYFLRLVPAVGTAALVAVGISAVQLVPTAEVVARASRGVGGLTVEQTMPMTPTLAALEGAAFASGPIAVLALCGLAGPPRLAALAAVLVAFTGAVGLGTPAYAHFFYRLPGVALFRLPQSIMHVGTLGLALLAGLGLDAFGARPPVSRWRRAVVLAVAVGVVALRWKSGTPVALTAASVAGVALLVLLPRPWMRVAAAWAVVILVGLERWTHPPALVKMPEHDDEAFFAPPPVVAFVHEHVGPDRIATAKNWNQRFPIMEKMGTLYGVPTAQDYEPLAPAVYHELLAPLDDANTDAPLFWGRVLPDPGDPGWSLFDLFAVRFVVVAPGGNWTASVTSRRWRPVYEGADATVYENLDVRPRIFIATGYRVVTDPTDTLDAVWDRDPAASRDVVVDREPVWREAADAPAIEPNVTLAAPSPDVVDVHVAVPRRALLVLADLYWPGWHVSVDGEEREMLRVDRLFRGVAVEPGSHEVRFRYAPWSVPVGRALTIATAVILIAAVARHRKATGRTVY